MLIENVSIHCDAFCIIGPLVMLQRAFCFANHALFHISFLVSFLVSLLVHFLFRLIRNAPCRFAVDFRLNSAAAVVNNNDAVIATFCLAREKKFRLIRFYIVISRNPVVVRQKAVSKVFPIGKDL